MGSVEHAEKPQYGRRLIPDVVDQIAREEPTREAFQIPRSEDAKDGWRVVTYHEYAKAIDACAWMITQACGQSEASEAGTPPTLAYIGPQDARYVVFFIAALKANCRALYISPRNTKEGQSNLFRKTNCRHVFCAGPLVNLARSWQSEYDLRIIEVGSYDSWAQQSNAPHFSYNKTWADVEWDAACVLHTSGSTGLPKPVSATHGMLGVGDACHDAEDWEGLPHWIRVWGQRYRRHFLPMPLFHAAALYGFIISVVWWKTPIALGFGSTPLTADSLVRCLAHLDVDAAVLPPSIVQDLSQDEEGLNALRKLKLVCYGGGSLAEVTGDYIVKRGVNLFNLISSTEFSPFPLYFHQRPELWQYFAINPDGCDWRPVDENIYELVMVRKHKDPGLQGIFYTFPDLQEVSTNDLFERHPTLPNTWKYHCRADDIIVFSNGEKLNPVTIEGMIEGQPRVKGALVFGARRFQPGLLIEPAQPILDESEKTDLVNDLWPHIVEANKATVAHGQIGKELIILTAPEKPMSRAGKGTIQRNATIASYKTEIDALYEKLELGSHEEVEEVDALDLSTEGIIHLVQDTFTKDALDLTLEADTNFFAVGVDSLQVIHMARKLRASLDAAGHGDLTPSVLARGIYNNPTPQRLSRRLLGLTGGLADGSMKGSDTDVERETEVMRGLYEKYTTDLSAGHARPDASSKDQVIVLTGSTGGLGSHLLAGLLADESVHRVICLNRAQDGGHDQQVRSMDERGLAPLRTGKAEFHHIDVGASNLGLPDDVYARLLHETDRIIHCGWPVNFNISTDTFEPHLRGVRSLCDLAARATKRIVYVFISSIGTTANWDPAQGHIPEEPLRDWKLPGYGYGRSKLIASAIIEDAAIVGNFPAASIRVGQIAGSESVTGAPWNKNEWLPSIIASSVHLSALPRDLGRFDRVDWIPIEKVARSVLDIAGVRDDPLTGFEESISGYYHVVNPTAVTWKELAPSVQAFYGDRIRDLVSFQDWVARLEKSQTSDDAQATVNNPGLKLLDTYQAAVTGTGSQSTVYDVSRTCRTSRTLRETRAISADIMQMWCAQWKF